jgi:hypothetical protein
MKPELHLTITYDSVSDLFSARLASGAEFTFSRENISGKLENNLSLFRRAALRQETGRFVPERKTKSQIQAEIDALCPYVPPKTLLKLTLEDLDLED